MRGEWIRSGRGMKVFQGKKADRIGKGWIDVEGGLTEKKENKREMRIQILRREERRM
jgi:hypothetical protein